MSVFLLIKGHTGHKGDKGEAGKNGEKVSLLYERDILAAVSDIMWLMRLNKSRINLVCAKYWFY